MNYSYSDALLSVCDQCKKPIRTTENRINIKLSLKGPPEIRNRPKDVGRYHERCFKKLIKKNGN